MTRAIIIGGLHHKKQWREQPAHRTELLALNDFRGHVRVGALQRLLRDHVLDAAHAEVGDLGGEAVRLLRVGAQQDIACDSSPILSARPCTPIAMQGMLLLLSCFRQQQHAACSAHSTMPNP